jgi:chemotaxis methyl-accepting protein methylase
MIPEHCLKLTLEQEFELRKLEADIDRLSLEQAKELVYDMVKQIHIKDNVVRYLIKTNAGII